MTQAQSPAVVIIARHGMRLDAADQSWHLSTPAPYDPPLTYGGWNQCRTLGTRIASLLHAREQQFDKAQAEQEENASNTSHIPPRRRRKKHKVVIHTSPFLRCVQTSVAISAGMAQFEEDTQKDRPKTSRSPATMHSASPRLHALSGSASPNLTPIPEPKHHLAHQLARRSLYEHKHYRKAKIRVDAFLGEWLNPQYFDHITPPPPSPMMVAGAKAELHSNEAVDLFTPSVLSHRPSNNSLWSGNGTRHVPSRESPLDDWSHVTRALQRPTLRRERSNSASSVGSNDSNASGRKSPFRPGHVLQPLASTIPKPEYSVYHPPAPSYAISNSDQIPRGYVSHARNATVNVDYNWDSSRAPLNWGNGGEFGEEWSSMHKRFRKGLNNMIEWYSQHNADDRGEDALGLDQADRPHIYHPEDEDEDLVVVLVTHGAGSNALIGALTAQPVLLDVGMASLTMAVRKEGVPAVLPPLRTDTPTPDRTPVQSPGPESIQRRRSSLAMGLSNVYEMKLVASSEHLRPGADPTKLSATNAAGKLRTAKSSFDKYKRSGAASHAEAGAGIEASWNLGEPKLNKHDNTSRALGSIRRPSAPSITRTASEPYETFSSSPPPAANTGLWTPPGTGRGTPTLRKEDNEVNLPKLNGDLCRNTKSSPDSCPSTTNGSLLHAQPPTPPTNTYGAAEKGKRKTVDSVIGEGQEGEDEVGDLPKVGKEAPSSLSRGMSVKGLWGNKPSGDNVTRAWKAQPKRRWTVSESD